MIIVENKYNKKPDVASGLLCYYPFNGNANNEAGTAIGNGTVYGATLTTDKLNQANQAYYFANAADNRIEIANNSLLSFGNGAGADLPFTISLWAFLTSTGGIFLAKNADPNYFEYSLKYDNSYLRLDLLTSNGGSYIFVRCGSTSFLNAWSHIVVTYDGSRIKEGISLFINKALQSVYRESSPGYYSLGMNNTNSPLYLGNSSLLTQNFNTKINKTRLYSRVLSSKDIAYLYYNYL